MLGGSFDAAAVLPEGRLYCFGVLIILFLGGRAGRARPVVAERADVFPNVALFLLTAEPESRLTASTRPGGCAACPQQTRRRRTLRYGAARRCRAHETRDTT